MLSTLRLWTSPKSAAYHVKQGAKNPDAAIPHVTGFSHPVRHGEKDVKKIVEMWKPLTKRAGTTHAQRKSGGGDPSANAAPKRREEPPSCVFCGNGERLAAAARGARFPMRRQPPDLQRAGHSGWKKGEAMV